MSSPIQDAQVLLYLIIGGTTKAGTSSLYFYLADHPQVCAANIKETRFFFNSDHYALPARYTLADGPDKYEAYFIHCREREVRMEATPDYLYSPETALWIRETLPHPKLIFILRDPIQRMVSWYRFARQQRLLPASITFTDYVDRQLESEATGVRSMEQPWRTLEQGRYAHYLQPYLETYNEHSLLILQYEDLKKDPVGLLMQVARFAGIDPAFYESYSFQVHNKTQAMRSNRVHKFYVDFRDAVRPRIHDKQRVWKAMRRLRRSFEPVYLQLNSRWDKPIVVADDLKTRLVEYYADDQWRLNEMLERRITPQPSSRGNR
jgi:hypothetical protein